MMDVGGSIDPYAELMSQLFSAAKRATHWRELRIYYFHNCIYGEVYPTEGFRAGLRAGPHRASAASTTSWSWSATPHGPLGALGAPSYGEKEEGCRGGRLALRLREHFERSVWLNPERPSAWAGSTVETIASIFPMYELTLQGLGDAVGYLTGGR